MTYLKSVEYQGKLEQRMIWNYGIVFLTCSSDYSDLLPYCEFYLVPHRNNPNWNTKSMRITWELVETCGNLVLIPDVCFYHFLTARESGNDPELFGGFLK